jgi:DNA (cytosine-5)-methyltransferase 1
MKVISLFSGAGGFDLGFINSGHEIVWANDILEDCVKTYKLNIGDNIIHGDIEKLKIQDIPDGDIVIGGFPCQGFSIANMNRKKSDPRNKLYLQFLQVLKVKKPKFFLAENVRGILSLEKGKVFQKIIADFTKAGYVVKHALLNAANYGVPQNRYRVFILGIREDLKLDINFPPLATHWDKKAKGLEKIKTIGQVLKDIPDPDKENTLYNHVYSKFKLKHNGYINHRKVNPKKPAPTVTARGDLKGGAMINYHPNNKRRLTVRETAIIQSLPIDFEICGSMTSCYLQVGNCVPPPLAKSLGEIFHKPIRKKNQIGESDKISKTHQLELALE